MRGTEYTVEKNTDDDWQNIEYERQQYNTHLVFDDEHRNCAITTIIGLVRNNTTDRPRSWSRSGFIAHNIKCYYYYYYCRLHARTR